MARTLQVISETRDCELRSPVPEGRKKKEILHINLLRKFERRPTDFLLFAHEAPSMPSVDQTDNSDSQDDIQIVIDAVSHLTENR